MIDEAEKIIRDIRALRIQGARNVAKAGIRALTLTLKKSRAKTREELYGELMEVAYAISETRPTEPMLRNILDDLIRFAAMEIASSEKSMQKMKKDIADEERTIWKKCRRT